MEQIDFHPIAQGDVSIEIAVYREEQDGITLAITGGTYGFPNHYYLLPTLLPNGGKVLDLGAHLGTFSLFAAALGYDVLAVEASPANVALLKASIARNGFDNLQIAPCAVSDTPGSCEFIPAGPYGIIANPNIEGPTVVVEAQTVPQLVKTQRWSTIDFIKMDIEGSEMAALRGMQDSMALLGMPALVYESNAHTLGLLGHTPGDVLTLLESAGYHCYYVLEQRLAPTTADAIQPSINMDCLALKEDPANHVLGNWIVTPPLSLSDKAKLVRQEFFHSHPHQRGYARTVLKQYGRRLLPGSSGG